MHHNLMIYLSLSLGIIYIVYIVISPETAIWPMSKYVASLRSPVEVLSLNIKD